MSEEQEEKMNGFNELLKFLSNKTGCELPNPESILESQSDYVSPILALDTTHGAAINASPNPSPEVSP